MKGILEEHTPKSEKHYYDLSVEKKFKLAEMESEYHLYYTLLSSDIHSSSLALEDRHATMEDHFPKLKLHTPAEEALTQQLEMLRTFLTIAQPCFDNLRSEIDQTSSK